MSKEGSCLGPGGPPAGEETFPASYHGEDRMVTYKHYEINLHGCLQGASVLDLLISHRCCTVTQRNMHPEAHCPGQEDEVVWLGNIPAVTQWRHARWPRLGYLRSRVANNPGFPETEKFPGTQD